MEFEKRKAQAMAAISAPEPDKSPKGSLDTPIIPLLSFINRHPSYFTTSSCSGRISILSHAPEVESSKQKNKKKAGGGGWLFVTHDPADPEAVVELLFRTRRQSTPGITGGALVLRFEPLIIAAECRDVASAQALVSAAVSCGFRESGITSLHKRVIVAIRCSIRLEVPLGQVGSIAVSADYVRYLVGIANEKMETNRRRTDGFLHFLQHKGFPEVEREKIDTNKKFQGSFAGKGILFDEQPNQLYLIPKVALLETDSLKFDGQDINSFYKNTSNLESTSSSGEGRGTDGSHEKSLEDIDSNDLEFGYRNKQIADSDPNLQLSRSAKCHLSVVELMIVGEPIEKLFLWGQSASALNNGIQEYIIIFGGFGGLGRHARRNYSLMLDPQSGLLKEIDALGPPSPRLGHTASVMNDNIFIIGGRAGPNQILNDVWVLNTAENKWKLLECTGSEFYSRHRHAAATVGSNIYIFGGLNNELIYSCMHVLDTENCQWSEINIQGEWPSARHSHSLVAKGHQLFMFGGYDGEKVLGDLYSFDVKTCSWTRVKATGRAPSPRFSHSMFIYNNYLGIIGGCPVSQQYQQLALLNLDCLVWVQVSISSVSGCLWVRSSATLVSDNLIIVGGGAACYAFGTKFNRPMKINLCLLDRLSGMDFDKENYSGRQGCKAIGNRSSRCSGYLQDNGDDSNENTRIENSAYSHGNCRDNKHFVLQFEKKYAKFAKDILKEFGWLDPSRKVQRSQDGQCICFPVTKNFSDIYQKKDLSSHDDGCQLETSSTQGLSINKVSVRRALDYMLSCDGSLLVVDVACSRKISKPPQEIMRDSVSSLLRERGMSPQLLEQLPTRWERLGEIVVLPVTSFRDAIWDSIGQELWLVVARSLGTQRLARQGRIMSTGTRDSTLEILVGDNAWVTHHENGIQYSFDATKCMFSSGNLSEKLRMGHLDCKDETIVDLFAGIGYFVLPFLVKAKARLIYACEWNPHALKALQHNVHANSVADRCIILEGDNRVTAPERVADRVCLGLLPSSESSWAAAVRALRVEGGTLHVHGNVKDNEEGSWVDYVVKSIADISQSQGLHWDVSLQHVERVKWYGPRIRHIVADVRCKQYL